MEWGQSFDEVRALGVIESVCEFFGAKEILENHMR